MADSRDVCLARKLHDMGIVHPRWTIELARESTNLGISLCAALLLQESGGGHNVFGHDPVFPHTGSPLISARIKWLNWIKGHRVTKHRYRRYLRYRKLGYGMQGVGPLQLTWYAFQDRADDLGGCWKPYNNMRIGFVDLSKMILAHDDLRQGIAAYNGSGVRANDYADQVLKRREKIHAVLSDCG